ncbi:MAG: ribosome biogenesis GTPase Der, partial [Thermodesulfobacteriota bacterium]
LRKAGKPVLFAANKVDSPKLVDGLSEFYELGLGNFFPISAEHGEGVYELMEALVDALPEVAAEPTEDAFDESDEEELEEEELEKPEEDNFRIRIALVGRPNAGKSSILNRILKKERAIVSEVPGTTVDPVDMPYTIGGKDYTFVDTAGIRRKTNISRTVESYSVMAAIKSIERCHVACLVIDGNTGPSAQDEKIAGLIERRGRAVVVVVNKWDIVERDTHTIVRFTEDLHRRIPFLTFAPVVFVSALTGKRIPEILKAADEVSRQARTRITTNKLNNLFMEIKGRKEPPVYRNRRVKLYYITQAGVRPPTFVVFTNQPAGVPDAYKRYVINRLRESLDIANVPIRLYFRKRE